MRKLFIDQSIESLRQDCLGVKRSFFERLLTQTTRYKSMPISENHPAKSTTYMGMAIANVSLAYLITKQPHLLKEAKRWIEAVLRYPDWGFAHLVNVDLSAAWILFGLSLGYDWIKEDIDEDLKKRIEEKLYRHATIMFDYQQKTKGKGWSTQYFQNHNWINFTGMAACGYALAGIYEEASLWTKEARINFDKVYAYMADDGSNYEGVVYWRYGATWLFHYAHLLKTAENVDVFKTTPFLQYTFDYRVSQAVPNLEETANFGDCHDTRSAHSAAIYFKTAKEYHNPYAQYLGELVINQFLYSEHYESQVKPGILPEILFELLYVDPTIAKKDFSDYPTFQYFEDLGLVSHRSSFDLDATYLTFKCGHPGGKKQWKLLFEELKNGVDAFGLSHQHPDNTSFILHAKGDYLVIDEGYNRNGHVKDHSVITVDGLGYDVENVNDVLKASCFARMKDQKDFDPLTDFVAEMTHVHHEAGISTFGGDAHKLYDPRLELTELSRCMIMLPHDIIVMRDHVKSLSSHTYEWHLNTPVEGVIHDGYVSYTHNFAHMDLFHVSEHALNYEQYINPIKAVMTTQEPDKFHEVDLNVLKATNQEKANSLDLLTVLSIKDAFDTTVTSVKKTDQGLIITKGDHTVFYFEKGISTPNMESDAAIGFIIYTHNTLSHVGIIDGTFLKVNQQDLITHTHNHTHFKEV